MTTKRRLRGFCRALLLAASVTALSAGAARAQDLRDLNDRILENPQDVELNLRYARLAEELGELRLALAAYERVLINNPDNEEAQRGFARVRRTLEPTYTSLRVEVGGQWDSNPRNLNGSDEEAYSVFGRATLVDERRFGSRRWRTNANFDGELVPEIDELNYAFMGAQTGPIMDVAPHLAAVPAVGVAVAALDGAYYFGEANLGVTLEGQRDGVSFWTRFRAGWRSYGEDSTAEEGAQAEIAAGVSIPRIASRTDALAIVPWVRWSGVEGSTFNFFNEEVAPGEYSELGLDVNYHYQFNDHVVVSAGALAYDRTFPQTEVAGEDRHDVYVSPQTTVTFQNLLPCQCALKATYRYRTNSSNDDAADYDAHQFSLSLVTRF
jgi:hypothetical protein